MPVKIGVTEEQTLINAALPSATSTYTVISHKFVIDTIRQELNANGFEIESEEFRCNSGANVAVGTFKIIYGNDPDLKLTYTFSNSYDKSLRFRAAIGACVNITGGYIISDVNNWRRKHTGTADTETEELIKDHIENASAYFDKLVADKEAMKDIQVDISTFGGILGELFIKGYLAIDQLSVIKKEYEKSSFVFTTPPDSLWTLYNHVLYALSTTHPSKWMINHVAIHLYLVSRFNLTYINDIDDSDLPEPFQSGAYEGEDLTNTEEEVKKQPDYLSGEQAENVVNENQINMFEELDENNEVSEEKYETPNMEELGQNVFTFDNEEEDLDDDDLEDLETQEAVEDKAPETIEEAVEETIIESIIEQSVEVAKEVQEIVNEAVENPSNDTGEEIVEEAEEVYFDCEDYEGVNVGDTIEEDDIYYDLIRKENIEGTDYFIGVAMDIGKEETLDDYEVEDLLEELEEDTFECFSPVDHARQARAAMSIEELSDEDLLDQYGTMNAEEINSAISKEAAIYHSDAETNEVVEDVIEEEYNDDLEAVMEALEKPDDKIKTALSSEIEELYGETYEFTYQDLGDQYSVTLETGEVANFSKSWIESQMNENL